MAITSIRENIRQAMVDMMETAGYTYLATNDKWNKYYREADFPTFKIVLSGPSEVVKEYLHRKKHRKDNFEMFVAPWNNCDDFEEVTSLTMEAVDKEFDEDAIKALVASTVKDNLGKISVTTMQVIIPDGNSTESKPYALVSIKGTIEYIN